MKRYTDIYICLPIEAIRSLCMEHSATNDTDREQKENERDEKKMSKAKTLNVASYDFVIDL